MCRRTGNEKHPLRIIFGVHSFCSCFIAMESRLHTTSDSSRLEFLYYLAIEHQNSSVDYALFDLMNSWCSLVSRQLFVACGMC